MSRPVQTPEIPTDDDDRDERNYEDDDDSDDDRNEGKDEHDDDHGRTAIDLDVDDNHQRRQKCDGSNMADAHCL